MPGDASRVLLDAVSLGVERGERIGVVGLNGGGKTTLLDILAGRREPQGGRVSRVGGLNLAHLAQGDALPPGARVRDVVLARYGAEHEWAADPKVRDVLDGLGLHDLDGTVGGLSGGEKRRVALAATLIGDPDLSCSTSPRTTWTSRASAGWRSTYRPALRGRGRHARPVVPRRGLHPDLGGRRAGVESYLGGYADWVYARAERSRQADAAEARRRNLARKELAWLRRGPPARTSKPRYRIEAAEELIADVPPPRDTVELLGFATNRLGRTVLELEDATVRIADRRAAGPRHWRLGPGDRIGIVGINGSGKTTLLRALTGERPLDGGRRVQGVTVQLAQLNQELVDLPGELRVLEATEAVAKFVRLGKLELTASSVLERLGFPASRQWTPVAQLSGGERRRLQLTRLLMAEPNVLLLDEPTNDLDVDTLAHLEDLLDGWPGTLVVVSHDRYLVERVVRHGRRAARRRPDHAPPGRDRRVPGAARGSGRRDRVDGHRRRPRRRPGRPGSRRRSSGRPARRRSGWSAGWRRCRRARRSCTRSSRRPRRTRTGSWRWTPSSGRWSRSASRWSWTGSRRRSSPSRSSASRHVHRASRHVRRRESAHPTAVSARSAFCQTPAHAAGMNSVIQVENLGKSFGTTRALDGVDLAVRRGTVLGLLGPTARARPPPCACSPRCCARTPGRARVLGHDVVAEPRRCAPGSG